MYNGDKSVMDDSVLEFEVDKAQRAERVKRRKDKTLPDLLDEPYDDLTLENEAGSSSRSKDKRRQKRRYLIYDEEQGRVVVKRRRKRRHISPEDDW